MARWIALKLIWLPRGIPINMAQTIVVLSLQLLRLLLFACFFPWLLCVLGPLYHLYIKNVFLHGDLVEEVYMEQPSRCCSGGVRCGVQVTPFLMWVETRGGNMGWARWVRVGWPEI